MTQRCAWVVLLMMGDAYLPGALVVARSLRDHKTAHQLVCMVTKDVSEAARRKLAALYDQVTEVEYIEHRVRPFASDRQQESYAAWISHGFTKWNCLSLIGYDRVVLVDADMLFVQNCDALFELPAPAACYSLPYAWPWQKEGGTYNAYRELCVEGDLPHGSRIPAKLIVDSLARYSFVGGGFLVLLEPDIARFMALSQLIERQKVYGADYHSTSGPDEISIAELYARDGVAWTHIHQRHAAIPWKPDWVAADIRAYHFHGRKPWDMAPDEYPDLEMWWRVYRAADPSAAQGGVPAPIIPSADEMEAELGMPPQGSAGGSGESEPRSLLAEALADYRLTSDLRALVMTRAKKNGRAYDKQKARKEVDNVLERWIIAMLAETREVLGECGSNRIYRDTEAAADFNCKLTGELADKRLQLVDSEKEARALVVAMLDLVRARLKLHPGTPPPPELTADGLRLGAHFVVELTPRLRLLCVRNLEAAALVAVRYAAIVSSGQQWGLPMAHYDHLYENYQVRGEAFASPLNSRLYGRPAPSTAASSRTPTPRSTRSATSSRRTWPAATGW